MKKLVSRLQDEKIENEPGGVPHSGNPSERNGGKRAPPQALRLKSESWGYLPGGCVEIRGQGTVSFTTPQISVNRKKKKKRGKDLTRSEKGWQHHRDILKGAYVRQRGCRSDGTRSEDGKKDRFAPFRANLQEKSGPSVSGVYPKEKQA